MGETWEITSNSILSLNGEEKAQEMQCVESQESLEAGFNGLWALVPTVYTDQTNTNPRALLLAHCEK